MNIQHPSERAETFRQVVLPDHPDARSIVREIRSPNGRLAADTDILRIHLLGGFSVSIGPRIVDESEWYLRKTRNLVKILALAPGHRMHRGQLVDLLWPDMDSDAAINNLHKALHIGRRVFEPALPSKMPSSFLHMNGEFVSLDPSGSLWIDVEAFMAAVQCARRTRDPAACEEALRLYPGDLLPSDRYEEWVIRRREQLRETHVALLLELARIWEERGEIDPAIDVLRRVVSSDPAHEEAQASLMRLLAQSGYRQLALRQYRQLCDALREELDVEPARNVQRLCQEILDGHYTAGSQPMVASPSSVSTTLPQPAESAPLVGREKELRYLDELLVRTVAGHGGLVLLSGSAGCGKSRLAAELRRRAEQRGAITLWGAAYRGRKHIPYGFLGVALEGFALRVAPDTLHSLLGESARELVKLAPSMAFATSPNFQHETVVPTDESRTLNAVSDFFDHLAEWAPIVTVFEDLQTAGEEDLHLLKHLASSARKVPVLFIGTFRSEEVTPGSAFAKIEESLTLEGLAQSFHLGPLRAAETEILVTELLGGPIDRSIVDMVQTLASGNPYYIGEAVHALRGRGRICVVDGVWHLRNGGVIAWDHRHLRQRRGASGDYYLEARLRG